MNGNNEIDTRPVKVADDAQQQASQSLREEALPNPGLCRKEESETPRTRIDELYRSGELVATRTAYRNLGEYFSKIDFTVGKEKYEYNSGFVAHPGLNDIGTIGVQGSSIRKVDSKNMSQQDAVAEAKLHTILNQFGDQKVPLCNK